MRRARQRKTGAKSPARAGVCAFSVARARSQSSDDACDRIRSVLPLAELDEQRLSDDPEDEDMRYVARGVIESRDDVF